MFKSKEASQSENIAHALLDILSLSKQKIQLVTLSDVSEHASFEAPKETYQVTELDPDSMMEVMLGELFFCVDFLFVK